VAERAALFGIQLKLTWMLQSSGSILQLTRVYKAANKPFSSASRRNAILTQYLFVQNGLFIRSKSVNALTKAERQGRITQADGYSLRVQVIKDELDSDSISLSDCCTVPFFF
jgi:hypothetical protein